MNINNFEKKSEMTFENQKQDLYNKLIRNQTQLKYRQNTLSCQCLNNGEQNHTLENSFHVQKLCCLKV